MPMLQVLQGAIHKLETGRGAALLRYALLLLAAALVLVVYDLRCFRNMSAPEAMDAAQLGRNLAQGKGFTTDFIRPFSIDLIKQKSAGATNDPAQLNAGHPDIANPPAYPFVLAGAMKVLPFKYDATLKGVFWSAADPSSPTLRRGLRYQPDFLIAAFNQFLFLVVIILTFFWARRMFDSAVAWTSVFLLLGAELLWRFSVSGLSTMLLLLIFTGLVWCLTLCERELREPKWGETALLLFSIAAGLLAGAGGLTRYACLLLIVPVLCFFAFLGGQRRAQLCAVAIIGFGVVTVPWITRNLAVSGKPFGVGSYNVFEERLPEFHLQRSLTLSLPRDRPGLYWSKLGKNLPAVVRDELPKIGGNWVSAFFLVGLMVGFRNPALRRLRYFLVGCILTLVIAQALSRTQLSDETPEINSENLLVVLVPALMVYGTGFFYVLLESIAFPFRQLRYAAIGLFAIVIWLPMLFAITAPKRSALAYPPYWPDAIENGMRGVAPADLVMSDVPWAVAWYGKRQCVWLTLNADASPDNARAREESFYAMNDLKPVRALYLTPRSLDTSFQSHWMRPMDSSWEGFVIELMSKKEVPPAFPLDKMQPGYWPEQLLLW